MQGVRLIKKNLLKSITACQSNKNWIKGNHKKTVAYVLNKVDLWVFSEDQLAHKCMRIIMHLGQVGTHQPVRDPRNPTNNSNNNGKNINYQW